MPSVSPAQHHLMEAAAHTKGGYGGVPQKVGEEFAAADEHPMVEHHEMAAEHHEMAAEHHDTMAEHHQAMADQHEAMSDHHREKMAAILQDGRYLHG